MSTPPIGSSSQFNQTIAPVLDPWNPGGNPEAYAERGHAGIQWQSSASPPISATTDNPPSAAPLSLDDQLRSRLGMRQVGDIGSALTSADQAGGGVGHGTVVGSALSGAGAGSAFGPAGTAIGGVAGLGIGMLAKYESDEAKRKLKKAQRARELYIWRQQQQWLAKNKDRLALQDKVDMAKLNAEFTQFTEDEKRKAATLGMDRMAVIADAMAKSRKPALDIVSEIY